MKKQFTLQIAEPCSQDFSKMTKNQIGSHCQLCDKNVLDFTGLTNREIAETIAKQKNKSNICARVQPQQLQQEYQYNTNANFINLKNAVVFASTALTTVAGFSQEKPAVLNQNYQQQMQHVVMGKIAMPAKPQIYKVVMQGNLIVSQTKKTISKAQLADLKLYYNRDQNPIVINLKTGRFLLELDINYNAKSIFLYADFKGNFQTIEVQISNEEIKSGNANKTIEVNTNPKVDFNILGGLGIIYKDKKEDSKLV